MTVKHTLKAIAYGDKLNLVFIKLISMFPHDIRTRQELREYVMNHIKKGTTTCCTNM